MVFKKKNIYINENIDVEKNVKDIKILTNNIIEYDNIEEKEEEEEIIILLI